MGLAVYNSTILDLRFPPCCFKKLLTPLGKEEPVQGAPPPSKTVGMPRFSLDDLEAVMPVHDIWSVDC
jgi:E3 ubiquitin-protein ligase HECTD2